MTKGQEIKRLLDEPRNGVNQAIRYNPLTPRFLISDGVKKLCDAAGCYWLLDILATELEPRLKRAIEAGEESTVHVTLKVTDGKARITTSSPALWSKQIPYTDFPGGEWTLFEVGTFDWDTETEKALSVIAILPSEH